MSYFTAFEYEGIKFQVVINLQCISRYVCSFANFYNVFVTLITRIVFQQAKNEHSLVHKEGDIKSKRSKLVAIHSMACVKQAYCISVLHSLCQQFIQTIDFKKSNISIEPSKIHIKHVIVVAETKIVYTPLMTRIVGFS